MISWPGTIPSRDEFGRVFEDFERHGRIAGDEIVVVEGMHKCAFDTFVSARFERVPARRPHDVGDEDLLLVAGHAGAESGVGNQERFV